MLTVGSLFAGIGGFDLGLERAGMRVIWQSEIDPYASAVLRKHWPEIPNHGDIRSIRAGAVQRPDLICGGFPCQPFSHAGKRAGKDDDRHLWPEMCRVIGELRPAWVVGENVAGIISMELDAVLSDLEALGYATRTFVIPAVAVDAPHRRDRVWIIACDRDRESACAVDAEASGLPGTVADADDGTPQRFRQHSGTLLSDEAPIRPCGGGTSMDHADEQRPQGPVGPEDVELQGIAGEVRSIGPSHLSGWEPGHWLPEPDVGRVADGVPSRVDRLRCLGNAIVPQIAEILGRAILESEAAR